MKNGMKNPREKTSVFTEVYGADVFIPFSWFFYKKKCWWRNKQRTSHAHPATPHHTRQHAPRNMQTQCDTHHAYRKGTGKHHTSTARHKKTTPNTARRQVKRKNKKSFKKTIKGGREMSVCVCHGVMSVLSLLSGCMSALCFTGSIASVRERRIDWGWRFSENLSLELQYRCCKDLRVSG